MRRWGFGLLLTLTSLVPADAAAQAAVGVASVPGVTIERPPTPAPRPTLPPHWRQDRRASPPPAGDLFLAGPDTYAPRYDRLQPVAPAILPGYVYAPGVYAPGAYVAPAPPVVGTRHHYGGVREQGALRLQISPREAHVYIDGFYAGTADDFRAAPYPLEAGAHHVEISADGFEAVAFDIRLRAHETVTYRTALEPIATRPAAPAPASTVADAAPKTLYVIPRCYAGDKPPVASQLPRGCSAGDVRELSAPPASR